MTESKNNEYELLHLSDKEKRELADAKSRDQNELFNIFVNRLHQKISSYKCEASGEVKLILALNNLLGREFTQHLGYPLSGYEQIYMPIRDKVLLSNNNFVIPNEPLSNELSVYVEINPEYVGEGEEGVERLTNNEKIRRTIEEFEAQGLDYKLYLYINTVDYDTYRTLKEDLETSLGREFLLVSMFPNLDMRAQAEVTVDYFPDSPLISMLDSFLTTFGLFTSRRKKVYFDYKADSLGKYFSMPDFLLLANSNLSDLLLRKEVLEPLAHHFTDLWLSNKNHLKFMYEEIEDFFMSPNLVLVKGLSPFYGIITGREIEIKGSKVDISTGEESLVKIKINNCSEINELYTEEVLGQLLRVNPKNVRSKMIRCQNDIIRVSSITKTLHVQGKNINSGARSNKYTLRDNLDSVTFITPYYRGEYYEALSKALKNVKPYELPARFKIYLMRSAHSRGLNVPEVDTQWFAKINSNMTDLLELLSGKFDISTILGYSISPLDGIINKSILVSLEAIQCHTKQK